LQHEPWTPHAAAPALGGFDVTDTTTRSVWFIVLDSRQGHLVEARQLPSGRLHLEVRADLREEWEEKLHERPAAMARGHEDEERLRRFGKQAAKWLSEQMAGSFIDHVTVFTSARMLGALRPALPAALHDRVDTRHDDLAMLRTAELAAHPAILALMSATSPAG
jgi:protein required for attachment to host cells